MLNLGKVCIGDGNPEWSVTTEPAEEPITLSEVKEYARIDGSAENNILTGFIKAVRKATETYLGRALITQTITLSLDYWPGDVIKLPRPPLISVNEVRYRYEDDTMREYGASNYYVRTAPEPGQLVLKDGVTYPLNEERYHGGYEIEFTAGYGSADDVPENIKEAMKLWVALVYEERVPMEEPPDIAKTLMNSERILPI